MDYEIWKDIKGYEGLYQVSNYGRVKSLDNPSIKNQYSKSRILLQVQKSIKKNQRYYTVALYKKTKRVDKKVHRLVAEAFIPNPSNLPQVNHKDENPENNYVSNLEWCTAKYNSNYGTRIKRIQETKKKVIINDL